MDWVVMRRTSAVVMVGGLIAPTLFTLLALPIFYMLVHCDVPGGHPESRA
jgi:multidrug efflux pump subunit AcrB